MWKRKVSKLIHPKTAFFLIILILALNFFSKPSIYTEAFEGDIDKDKTMSQGFSRTHTPAFITANGRTALNGLHVSARADGSATLTHASSANTDQNLSYCVIG